MPRGPTTPTQLGAAAEERAAAMLQAAGLTLVARNVRFRVGEIDLILRDGPTCVFVEVRLRRNQRFGGAASSIDAHKQRRLIRAAELWLLQTLGQRERPPCRFDVVIEGPDGLEWLRNAFMAS